MDAAPSALEVSDLVIMNMDEPTFEAQEVDLRAYWQTLKKRRLTIIACLVAVVAIVGLMTYTQKPVYQASAKVLSKGSRSNQADLLTASIPALGAFADQRDVQTQVEIIKSWPIMKEAAEQSGMSVVNPGAIPVKVDGGKDNNIITITASSTEPGTAQLLANNVAKVYVDHNLAEARSSAHKGRVFLEGQQGKVTDALEHASKALRNYQMESGVVSLDAATAKQVETLATLESNIIASKTEKSANDARARQLRQQLAQTDANIVSGSQIVVNPAVQKLQESVTDLTVERAGLLKDYAPTSVKVRAIDAQINLAAAREKTLVRNILSSKSINVNPVYQQLLGGLADAEGQALASAARVAGLERSVQDQRAVLHSLPEEQYVLAQLQRDVSVKEKTYLALQDRYQQLRIAEESTLANAQVLEPALLPGAPVSPKVKLNMILAVLVGLMLGIGAAALQEALDDAIWTGEDVERELGLPLLGLVHNISDPNERSLLRAGPMSGVSEAFRLIRSNIKFMAVDKEMRTLMVTSATKGEGKSTTACNLAIALAQDGKKVTLVDTDLRRPSVHKQFGIPNTAGLTNAIVSAAPLAEVEHDVDIENLRVITAGPIPPNPAELLDTARFAHIVEELQTTNDIVVFDAPPVLGVADSSVLGGRMDGVVMVVSAGGVERGAARRTVQMLQQARAHLLGVVLNKMDEQNGGYYYNYYYYQYHADDGTTKKRRKRHKGDPRSKAGRN